MKKIVRVDYRANKELVSFPKNIQFEFKGSFRTLEINGKLDFQETKKLDNNLYEIRINLGGAHRGLYAYVKKEYVVILHIFRKKTQKTPARDLKLAKRRLKEYE